MLLHATHSFMQEAFDDDNLSIGSSCSYLSQVHVLVTLKNTVFMCWLFFQCKSSDGSRFTSPPPSTDLHFVGCQKKKRVSFLHELSLVCRFIHSGYHL